MDSNTASIQKQNYSTIIWTLNFFKIVPSPLLNYPHLCKVTTFKKCQISVLPFPKSFHHGTLLNFINSYFFPIHLVPATLHN